MWSTSMKKILIVDHNPDVRYVLHAHLEWMGCTAITAETGKDAVKVAIAENPDLILMDIMMPEMDGRETTRVLRSNPETKNIPILATTALLRPSDIHACIEAGCTDYIVKPFTPDKLLRKFKSLVR
jgi:CheY-like chemotaxis protein